MKTNLLRTTEPLKVSGLWLDVRRDWPVPEVEDWKLTYWAHLVRRGIRYGGIDWRCFN